VTFGMKPVESKGVGRMNVARVRKSAAWGLVVALTVASVVLLPAVAPARTRVITGSCVNGCSWKPAVRRIRVGSRIVWRVPNGDTRHNVTAFRARGSRRWTKDTDIAPGSRTGRTFRRPGLYRFLCEYHPTTMRGYVRVTR
jgi:plastocyanin